MQHCYQWPQQPVMNGSQGFGNWTCLLHAAGPKSSAIINHLFPKQSKSNSDLSQYNARATMEPHNPATRIFTMTIWFSSFPGVAGGGR